LMVTFGTSVSKAKENQATGAYRYGLSGCNAYTL